jgi:hypothetical protein
MGFVEAIHQISPAEETPERGLELKSTLKFIYVTGHLEQQIEPLACHYEYHNQNSTN